jgi:CSLREA domain-containing protein
VSISDPPSRNSRVGRRALGWVAAFALLGALVIPASAPAATISPTTTGDEFDAVPNAGCSLREAVRAANIDAAFGGCPAGSGSDRIELAGGAYGLSRSGTGEDATSTGDLDITGPLSVVPSGVGSAVIDGGGLDRVIDNSSSGVEIAGLWIRNGAVSDAGGGLRNAGVLSVSGTTISDSLSSGDGGGVSNGGSLSMTNVTISGNRANSSGGGLSSEGGESTLNNVTVTKNEADADASGSGDGGGLNRAAGALKVLNTALGDNLDRSPGSEAPNCAGAVTSQGYSVIGSINGCDFTAGEGDQTGVRTSFSELLLGGLADNGGPTPTHGFVPGTKNFPESSPVSGAGNPAQPGSAPGACAPTDQRGLLRELEAPCDAGAYQLSLCHLNPESGFPTIGLVTNFGTGGDDDVTGTEKVDVFQLFDGNDTGTGLGEGDLLCGGDGEDTLIMGDGEDGAEGDNGRDSLSGGLGKDILGGGDAGDLVKGGKGGDDLGGGFGRDRLKGGKGGDFLAGGNGPDKLKGGKGRDRCVGGKGRDTASGCERRRKIP